MDEPQPKKNSDNININSDYISKLPADIKEKILAELSLKEAARTSILSSTWKDSWTSHPNLVFEEKYTESRLIELVDKVLRVHRGPIRKFKLISEHACSEAIGRWMLILSTNEIEHLHLHFRGIKGKIPSRFFSCNALKSVCLTGYSFNVPQVFNDFTLLHTLYLSHFNLSGFGIEKLVSSCPLLEHLELNYFSQEGCLHILAPNLTFLAINGDFHDICLETPKLAMGIIRLFGNIGNIGDYAKDVKESNITRALGHLSNIQKLAIWGVFIDYLARGPIPKNLPAMFKHLSEISVDLCSGLNVIALALYLFQSAPNLKELCIKLLYFRDPPYVEGSWESKAIRDCLFKRLEAVNIMYVCLPGEFDLGETESMLEFAKLVLISAPLLEEFHVTGFGDDIVVFEELKLFPKLSEKCKIVLLTHHYDEGSNGDEGNDGDEESDDDEA